MPNASQWKPRGAFPVAGTSSHAAAAKTGSQNVLRNQRGSSKYEHTPSCSVAFGVTVFLFSTFGKSPELCGLDALQVLWDVLWGIKDKAQGYNCYDPMRCWRQCSDRALWTVCLRPPQPSVRPGGLTLLLADYMLPQLSAVPQTAQKRHLGFPLCVSSQTPFFPAVFILYLPPYLPWGILFFLFGYQSTALRVKPRCPWDHRFLLVHLFRKSSCWSFSLCPQLRSVSHSVCIIFRLNQIDEFFCQFKPLLIFNFFWVPIAFCISVLSNILAARFSVFVFLLGCECSYCGGFVRRCLGCDGQGSLSLTHLRPAMQ